MRPCLLFGACLLIACGESVADPADGPGPAYSGGACPTLVAGAQTFVSGDLSYDVTVRLPAEPAGAPILFVFHGLGGTSAGIDVALEVDTMVSEGAVTISPQAASGADFEWSFVGGPEGNPDLQLFHDLLGCARRQLDIDLRRVWVTGMSAGGLWASYLVLHASEWVTAAAPFSGGLIGYAQPTTRPVPAMLTWGGPTDTARGLNFDASNIDLAFVLGDFGHPVIECVHDLGHAIPSEGPAMMRRFFRDQRWGDGDPFALGLPQELPAWCAQQ